MGGNDTASSLLGRPGRNIYFCEKRLYEPLCLMLLYLGEDPLVGDVVYFWES